MCLDQSQAFKEVTNSQALPYKEKKRETSCLLHDLGLALAPKMCPDQSQALKEVNNSQAFTVGRKKITHFFCLDGSLPGAPRNFVQSLAQIFEELTA